MITFSSILLPAFLGLVARMTLGHQRWYWGILFFLLAYPIAVVVLTGLYLGLGGSGAPVVRLAGQNAFFGALAGAILLCASFGETSDD